MREGLKKAIKGIPDAPYPLMITANPDGEGCWFAETSLRNADEARQYKNAYKTDFTPDFAVVRARWVRDCNQPLALVDVGGKITDENLLIMEHATHAVILSRDVSKFNEWKDFCELLNLRIIAMIYSDYYGKEDLIESKESIFRGSVHYPRTR